jgi:hypothetical protein
VQVVSATLCLLYLLEREPMSIVQGVRWAPEPVWIVVEDPPPWIVQPVASRLFQRRYHSPQVDKPDVFKHTEFHNFFVFQKASLWCWNNVYQDVVHLSCFRVRLLYATERPQQPGRLVTPAILRDTVKEIFCIYMLKGDERSVFFVSHVVGRNNAVSIHISLSSFR